MFRLKNATGLSWRQANVRSSFFSPPNQHAIQFIAIVSINYAAFASINYVRAELPFDSFIDFRLVVFFCLCHLFARSMIAIQLLIGKLHFLKTIEFSQKHVPLMANAQLMLIQNIAKCNFIWTKPFFCVVVAVVVVVFCFDFQENRIWFRLKAKPSTEITNKQIERERKNKKAHTATRIVHFVLSSYIFRCCIICSVFFWYAGAKGQRNKRMKKKNLVNSAEITKQSTSRKWMHITRRKKTARHTCGHVHMAHTHTIVYVQLKTTAIQSMNVRDIFFAISGYWVFLKFLFFFFLVLLLYSCFWSN